MRRDGEVVGASQRPVASNCTPAQEGDGHADGTSAHAASPHAGRASASAVGGKTFHSLEGLRGVLALSVVCGHYNFGSWLAPFGLAYNFQLAVDVFFMLSGFVLTHSNYRAATPVAPLAFTVKRFARLYPLHIATFVVMAILYRQQGLELQPWQMLRQALLLHGDNVSTPHFNGPSWSIAVEFWGSIMFLFLTGWFARSGPIVRRILLACAMLCVAAAAALLHTIIYDDPSGSVWPGWGNYLRGAAGFCLGILAYAVTPHTKALPAAAIRAMAYAASLIIAMFFLLKWPPATAIVFYGASFSLIVAMAADPDLLPMLSSRVFVWLGAISYAIYLTHDVLYPVFEHAFGAIAVKGLLGKVILLPTLLLLSALIYRWFERPTQDAIRRAGLPALKPVFG
jgi:peptidoglycan/LPS O-acetylase OafA/YrhL